MSCLTLFRSETTIINSRSDAKFYQRWKYLQLCKYLKWFRQIHSDIKHAWNKNKNVKRRHECTSSAADAGPGEEASRLGPGAPTGGAGGPSNAGEGAGALCFLPFFVFFFDLLGAAAGTSALGVTAGVEAVGGELTGTGVGGELTGTGAGGELTGAGFGGVLTGATTGGDAAGDLATGTGAAGETAGVTVAAVGDEAGGDDFGEATGAGDFGLVGAATGAAEGVVTVGGDVVGADDGDWPPTPAKTMQINASERTFLQSIF